MAKILVKKSAPKGVLVKQVQPQLMQTPKGGKSFMDFARTAFGPRRTKDKVGVSPKARLAALAGVVGKLGAGVSTVNDTMNAMQGGNISAPLGMGYTFEAKDPTGRMISDAADPTLSYKPPKLSNAPPAKFSVDAALGNIANKPTGPTGPPLPADSPLARFGNPEAGLAPRIPGREQREASTYPQHTMSRRTAFNQLGAGQPTGVPFQAQRPSPVQVPPTHVPGAVASNITPMPVSQTQPPGYPGNQTSLPPPQPQLPPLNQALATLGPQSSAQPIPPLQQPQPQPTAPQPTAPPVGGQITHNGQVVQPDAQGNYNAPGVSITGINTGQTGNNNSKASQAMDMFQQVQAAKLARMQAEQAHLQEMAKIQQGQSTAAPQQTGQVAQQTGQVTPPGDQSMLVPPEQFHQGQIMTSFVTALTEKLGADIVYKMSPHEIGTFAAYTLLKLR